MNRVNLTNLYADPNPNAVLGTGPTAPLDGLPDVSFPPTPADRMNITSYSRGGSVTTKGRKGMLDIITDFLKSLKRPEISRAHDSSPLTHVNFNSLPIHALTPRHAHAHRIAQSISDPTPIGGSLGRNNTRGRVFEGFSHTPGPNTVRARAKESQKKVKSRIDKLRLKRRDGAGCADSDDGANFSSGSAYYAIPSQGQKIKLVVLKLAVQHPFPQSHLAVMAVPPILICIYPPVLLTLSLH